MSEPRVTPRHPLQALADAWRREADTQEDSVKAAIAESAHRHAVSRLAAERRG